MYINYSQQKCYWCPQKSEIIMAQFNYYFSQYCYINIGLFSIAPYKVMAPKFLSFISLPVVIALTTIVIAIVVPFFSFLKAIAVSFPLRAINILLGVLQKRSHESVYKKPNAKKIKLKATTFAIAKLKER